MGTRTTPSNPTIHITVLTIATLLILSLLILIIGPSRVLSDSYSSSNCPAQHINLDIPQHQHSSSSSSSSNSKPQQQDTTQQTLLQTSPYDGLHLRKWTAYPFLTQQTMSASFPNQTWESLLSPPNAAGGIRVPQAGLEGSKFDNMPGQTAVLGPDGQVGHVVGMMHQLHCLIMIRSLIFPENNNVDDQHASSKVYGGYEGLRGESKRAKDKRGHVSHCFEYLAQSIICAADDTLEAPTKIHREGGVYWAVTGEGAIHQCKDPRPIWEMAIRTHLEPRNMSDWNDGVGVREFFADELKETGYRHEMPEIFRLGVLGGLFEHEKEAGKEKKG